MRGRITNEFGEPVKDAVARPYEVNVERFVTELDKYVKSGSNGKYKITGLPMDNQKYMIRFAHDYYCISDQLVEYEEGETECVLDVVLEEGFVISGFVTDSDSEPIEDAQIKASCSSNIIGMRRMSKRVISDTEGSYSIYGITDGHWRLVASKENYAPSEKDGVVVTDTDLDWIDFVLEEGLSISGRVLVEKDTPFAHQKINFHLKAGRLSLERQTVTDTEGGFIINDLPERVFNNMLVYGQYPERKPFVRQFRKRLEDIPAGADNVVFKLDSYDDFCTITGKVIDAVSQGPVTDFDVNIFGWNKDITGYDYLLVSSFTSEDGLFSMYSPRTGKLKLEVWATGYAEKSVENIIVEKGGNVEDIVIALVKGYQITGRLVNAATSEPVEGAKIIVNSKDTLQKSLSFETISNEDGGFATDELTPGNYTLKINHRDFASKTIETHVVNYTMTYLGDIFLSTGGSIEGKVTDENDNPFVSAQLVVQPFERYTKTLTDENGFYKISGVSVGEVTVLCNTKELSHGRARFLSKAVTVTEGVTSTVDFIFTSGVTVRGEVKNNGDKIVGARIILSPIDESTNPREIYAGKADEGGRFAVENVAPGRYLLTAMYEQTNEAEMLYQHKELIDVGYQENLIKIETHNSLVSGRTLDASGKPVAAQLLLFEPLDLSYHADKTTPFAEHLKYMVSKSQSDGKFTMGSITPGRYRVGTSPDEVNLQFQPITEIEIPEGKDLTDVTITIDQ